MLAKLRTIVPAVVVIFGVAACGTAPDHVTVPTDSVTLSVDGQGTADITWSGNPGGGTVHTSLPWHTTLRNPAQAPSLVLSVVLDEHGGTATCAIAVDGHRVGSSLAQGRFGRANCHTPATEHTDLQAND